MKKTQRPERGVIQWLLSKRWIVGYLVFYGSACLYIHRTNLNLAIICMVKTPVMNQTHIAAVNTSDTNQTEVLNTDHSSCDTDYMYYDPMAEYERAEFDWSKGQISSALSSYYYGAVATQVIGGVIATKFGSKVVIAVSIAIRGLCCLLTPVITRASFYGLFVIRVLLGLCGGVVNPAFFNLLGKWTPDIERGSVVGTVIPYAMSGYLCTIGFDSGWASIFYIHGVVTMVFVILWLLLIWDGPSQHPTITEAEKDFIEETVGEERSKVSHIPWRDIVTSRPMMALVFMHICSNWSGYVILINIPLFMKEVLKFDIKQNGLYSSLPHVTRAVTSFLYGYLVDCVAQRQMLGTTSARRTFAVTAFLGLCVCLLAVCFLPCDQRAAAVVLLCLSNGFYGATNAGVIQNHLDIAARYSGITYAISNTVANTPGIIAPLVTGLLTPQGSPEEWSHVFYVCIGISLAGALVFGTLSQGRVQSWAVPGNVYQATKQEEH